jgi:hypothetical protein
LERIVATYTFEGREINVVEIVDEDAAWYEIVVENRVLNEDAPLDAVPSQDEVRRILTQLRELNGGGTC